MPVIAAAELINEEIIAAAKEVALGAQTAPQVSNKTIIETAILYGQEELIPHVEILEALGGLFEGFKGEAESFRKIVDEELPFALVLVGAKTDRSDLGYDCNACGFSSCAEFNKYAKKHFAFGGIHSGPSCVWKVLDWGISWDFGAAIAYARNLPTRAHSTIGITSEILKCLPACSNIGGLSLGPIIPRKGRVWEYWYSRDYSKNAKATVDDFFANYVRGIPSLWVAQPAWGVNTHIKYANNFQDEPWHITLAQDPQLLSQYQKVQEKIAGIVKKYTGKGDTAPVVL